MDLAKFAKMPAESGAYLKFKADDNIKIVRFLYDKAEDISCRQKYYDPAQKKVIYDTPEGKWTMALKVAVYKSRAEYEIMTWDRTARFGAEVLLPIFESAGGKISDTVYKVTCTKPGTLEASFTLFPMKDSESYAMPEYSNSSEEVGGNAEAVAQTQPAQQVAQQPVANTVPQPTATQPAPAPTQAPVQQSAETPPKRKKNFWEED